MSSRMMPLPDSDDDEPATVPIPTKALGKLTVADDENAGEGSPDDSPLTDELQMRASSPVFNGSGDALDELNDGDVVDSDGNPDRDPRLQNSNAKRLKKVRSPPPDRVETPDDDVVDDEDEDELDSSAVMTSDDDDDDDDDEDEESSALSSSDSSASDSAPSKNSDVSDDSGGDDYHEDGDFLVMDDGYKRSVRKSKKAKAAAELRKRVSKFIGRVEEADGDDEESSSDEDEAMEVTSNNRLSRAEEKKQALALKIELKKRGRYKDQQQLAHAYSEADSDSSDDSGYEPDKKHKHDKKKEKKKHKHDKKKEKKHRHDKKKEKKHKHDKKKEKKHKHDEKEKKRHSSSSAAAAAAAAGSDISGDESNAKLPKSRARITDKGDELDLKEKALRDEQIDQIKNREGLLALVYKKMNESAARPEDALIAAMRDAATAFIQKKFRHVCQNVADKSFASSAISPIPPLTWNSVAALHSSRVIEITRDLIDQIIAQHETSVQSRLASCVQSALVLPTKDSSGTVKVSCSWIELQLLKQCDVVNVDETKQCIICGTDVNMDEPDNANDKPRQHSVLIINQFNGKMVNKEARYVGKIDLHVSVNSDRVFVLCDSENCELIAQAYTLLCNIQSTVVDSCSAFMLDQCGFESSEAALEVSNRFHADEAWQDYLAAVANAYKLLRLRTV